MSSRDTILGRIRSALSEETPPEQAPSVPEVWPRTNPDVETMANRFASEIAAVQGECVECKDAQTVQSVLAELMEQNGWSTIAAADRPVLRTVLEGFPASKVIWQEKSWTAPDLESTPVALISAERLIADTGSCLIQCDTKPERLLCYLPPACIVVGSRKQLAEHLPAAWEDVSSKAAESDRRGEFVIVTGPSRTADIEKILILGVHGPKRLIVLMTD